MSSYRIQIAEAMKATLIGKTPAGDRVFANLDRQLDPRNDFPAIVIYTMGSRRGTRDMGQSIVQRHVTVTVEAAVTSTPEAAQSDAEAMAAMIEDAVEADPSLGGLVNDTQWQESHSAVTSAASKTIGVCLVDFEVEIFSERRNIIGPDDGFAEPPHIVFSNPRPTMPADERGPGCPGGICDTPAWGGEVEP